VGDVARAVYLATLHPISGVFNIVSGVGLSLNDILSEITTVVGVAPRVTWLPSRSFDVPRIVLNAAKFRAATDWGCRTTLKDGLAITADWLRSIEI
jgi:nucleoside-diphosphate-sugar epimerase